jgi:catechol-2,3-dioxygenase
LAGVLGWWGCWVGGGVIHAHTAVRAVDQMFRVVAEAFRKQKFISTMEEYARVAANAWKSEAAHFEYVEAVVRF